MKLSQINEGLKLDQKAYSTVLKGGFKIGIEYEYHIDQDKIIEYIDGSLPENYYEDDEYIVARHSVERDVVYREWNNYREAFGDYFAEEMEELNSDPLMDAWRKARDSLTLGRNIDETNQGNRIVLDEIIKVMEFYFSGTLHPNSITTTVNLGENARSIMTAFSNARHYKAPEFIEYVNTWWKWTIDPVLEIEQLLEKHYDTFLALQGFFKRDARWLVYDSGNSAARDVFKFFKDFDHLAYQDMKSMINIVKQTDVTLNSFLSGQEDMFDNRVEQTLNSLREIIAAGDDFLGSYINVDKIEQVIRHYFRDRMYDKIVDKTMETFLHSKQPPMVDGLDYPYPIDFDEEYERGSDLIKHLKEEYQEEIDETAYERYAESHADITDETDQISRLLTDPDNQWKINPDWIGDITTDTSVERGVELITRPLPLDDALEMLDKMLEHISDVGYTSHSTGMHVNISSDVVNFSDLNYLKMALLMDPDYTKGKYPERQFVENVFDQISGETIDEIANNFVHSRGVPTVAIKKFELLFKKYARGKYYSINFGHVADGYVSADSRIEFRFFGGEDYENRYAEMKQDIIRTCYAMYIGGTKAFEKEYYREIYEFLNKKFLGFQKYKADLTRHAAITDLLSDEKTTITQTPIKIKELKPLGVFTRIDSLEFMHIDWNIESMIVDGVALWFLTPTDANDPVFSRWDKYRKIGENPVFVPLMIKTKENLQALGNQVDKTLYIDTTFVYPLYPSNKYYYIQIEGKKATIEKITVPARDTKAVYRYQASGVVQTRINNMLEIRGNQRLRYERLLRELENHIRKHIR